MINKYSVLLRVIEVASLTAAAEQIGYTQSGVSQIIGSLENELGFPLLYRGKDGVTPTKETMQILPYIQEMVRQNDLMQQVVADIKGLKIGTVRIGAITSVAQFWLPKIITLFKTAYPGIDLQLKVAAYQEIESWLLNGSVDCGFISNPQRQNLEFARLSNDKMLVVLPTTHHLTEKEQVPISSIADVPFIMPSEGSGHDIGRILRNMRIKPCVQFSVNDDYVALSMVKAGIGITILPELLLRDIKEGICIKEFDPPQCRQLGIAISSKRKTSIATNLFVHFVKNQQDITNS